MEAAKAVANKATAKAAADMAADKAAADKAAAAKAAADKAAAAKAQQEAEDAQLAAALAASLAVSGPVPPPPPPSLAGRVKRWGDGLEAPAAGSRHFVPQGFEVGDVVVAFPTFVDEPRVYLSAAQGAVCARYHELKDLQLPGWVRLSLVAGALGHGMAGIQKALEFTEGEPWLWATEFENVHETWTFAEPRLTIGGKEYRDSEAYYQAQKPVPFDAQVWDAQRVGVMRTALAAKFAASGEARALLVASHPHRLLSIKSDRFWGFDPALGGQNMLAVLLTEMREGYVHNGAALVARLEHSDAGVRRSVVETLCQLEPGTLAQGPGTSGGSRARARSPGRQS
jgi:predicted NAD-dependent protein-ADP-ribosyltransferase YbiA (DUF1768 family)